VVAYRHLSGNSLSEREQVVIRSSRRQRIDNGPDPAGPAKEAAERWRLAKTQAGFSRRGVSVYKRAGAYSHFLNCPAPAFLTAIDTLQARSAYHGPKSDDLRDWVQAQDQVFSNCSGGGDIPGPPRPSIDSLLQADRSYQVAAAHFYSGSFDEAHSRFREIGSDSDSPWRVWGRYLAGRSLIRKATIPFDSWGYDSETLEQAEGELTAVLDDPTLEPTHTPARQLLALIAFKKPANDRGVGDQTVITEELRRLSQVLQDPKPDDDFNQLAETYRGMITRLPRMESDELDDMSRWILSFRRRSFANATLHWKRTKAVPWLVAALTSMQPSDSEGPSLLLQAKEIPAFSPAYASVAYHSARVLTATGAATEAREWLTAALENETTELPLSATNELLGLRMATARSLDEFLADAPRRVVALAFSDGSERELFSSLRWKSFKRLGSRTFFDSGSALTFNRQLPLGLLIASAKNLKLPRHLRKRVAVAAWTRAIMLKEMDRATAISEELGELAAELRAGLRSVRSSTSDDDRYFEALMMIMRNPGLRPTVQPGVDRLYPVDKNYRTVYNWWCDIGRREVLAWRNGHPGTNAPWPLGFPDFVGSKDREAARDELDRLIALGPGYEFVGRQVIARAGSHPNDPRLPEALHRVVSMTRWSCLASDKGDVSQTAFQILHNRYPNSEWTEKTPYWFR